MGDDREPEELPQPQAPPPTTPVTCPGGGFDEGMDE